MNISDLMDTPRLYTGLAEWTACFLYILLLKPRQKGIRLILSLAGMLGLQMLYQCLAGTLPLYLWIVGMMGAILLMYLYIFLSCDISYPDALFCCVRAFVLAEFAASFQWQLYVWYAMHFQHRSQVISLLIMLLCYLAIYTTYYLLERDHIPRNERMNVTPREMMGAASIALGAFAISNLSFVMPNTPFSGATSSILYVRTLADFGGLVMLFAQQDKREELRMRSENQSMNVVLQRQYDQYRLAQENMELLRREFHDLKHYIIAIRAESNPHKREHYLEEMEQAILTQEALANTGNQVLDVVLTTKSTYCTQKKITFHCLADGALIHFMDVKDICSIFGNALDNAIECVEHYSDPDQRLITLSMRQEKQLLLIEFENYLEKNLEMKDRLPVSTKSNKLYHGYGLKSIRAAAQSYGGTMTIHTEGNWFTLQVLIPLKSEC